jgi:glucose-6-phosphate isomerase
MKLTQGVVNKLTPGIKQAIQDMHALEAGDIANPDEERMVGHYWLRDPERAPNDDIRQEILHAKAQIKTFVEAIHNGTHKPPHADKFKHLLLVGIGGSALGPQWIDHALTSADAPMKAHYFDNTDPDGMARILDEIGAELNATLVVVISKSGGTKETRNGMLTAERAFEAAGLAFGPHAVAVTGVGSKLAQTAIEKGFIGMFPMWDWVGGRTSLFSAVGLLPAGLLGIDTDALLAGAAAMDELTRRDKWKDNPAAWLAIAWWHATNGRAERAMALLPYKDRLLLFGRYSQQLIMESLGKQLDRNGQLVHQGLTVYGNKGSTDQHALVQQLREGPDDFFAAFIEVLQDREDGQPDPEVEPGLTSGDYLLGFLLGTREALRESGKRSFTLTLPNASPHSLGMLVALFERTVGLYASLLDINAYHQPGVEAGKRAATGYLALQSKALEHLQAHPNTNITLLELATALGVQQDIDALYYLLQHLTANGRLESIHHQIPTYLYKK